MRAESTPLPALHSDFTGGGAGVPPLGESSRAAHRLKAELQQTCCPASRLKPQRSKTPLSRQPSGPNSLAWKCLPSRSIPAARRVLGSSGHRASRIDLRRLFGRAEYTAHLGAISGGANAVYWLEVQGRGARGVRVRNLVGKAKRHVTAVEAEIEPDLLYPLVRWIDVDRWSARPSAHLLLRRIPRAERVSTSRFRRDYPRSLGYLQQFEPLLASRAAYRRYQGRQPFYSMYNVGPYTLSAAKVIWRRMDSRIRAAVLEPIDDAFLGPRPIIPQETCVLIASSSADEAHCLCAVE